MDIPQCVTVRARISSFCGSWKITALSVCNCLSFGDLSGEYVRKLDIPPTCHAEGSKDFTFLWVTGRKLSV